MFKYTNFQNAKLRGAFTCGAYLWDAH
ncbi:MAG: hypothetical protein KTR27_15125 [Leptolyngbyaceae cyanobacterium MAG.088]|nr:hypothetical protein [Leptolyngbyaceae cyanobacterium MAG.088]